MKNQAIQYLALDVHQATVVGTARDEQGTIRMRARVAATEANAILGLVRGLGPRVHVAFEEGTQAQWLHDVLQPTPSGWWSATCAGGVRQATRAIGSMPMGCRRCCVWAR